MNQTVRLLTLVAPAVWALLCCALAAADDRGPELRRLVLPPGEPVGEISKFQRPAQPSWATPPPIEEPTGEAVLIDDTAAEPVAPPKPKSEARIALATAYMELVSEEATKLQNAKRELAENAETVDDLTALIELCNEQSSPASPHEVTTDTSSAKLQAWAYSRRGELRAAAGDEHAAFEDFQQAISIDPACWQALHNRGVTLARYARHLDALADFTQVIELAPHFLLARQNRGEVFCQLGRWGDAVKDYSQAIELCTQPTTSAGNDATGVEAIGAEAQLLVARGTAWRQLGKVSEAAQDFNLALRLNDTLATAYVGRGNLFAEQGHYEQAAEDFQQALRCDPRSAAAYRSVAWLLATCPLESYRNADKAIEAGQRAAKLLGTDSPHMLDLLAATYANAGDFPQAIKHQQQALVLAEGEIRKAYAQRLALYRSGKPFRTR